MKTEAKVGLFITLSLVFLFGLLSQLSSFDNMFKKSYPIMAKIDDGAGLKAKAKVKLKGVNIGFVDRVALENNAVITHLLIDEGVMIPNNSIIVVSQDSLLGGKFLDINPGDSTESLQPNMLLDKQEKQSSIADASTAADEAFQEIKLLVSEIRTMLKGGAKDDIEESLANINEFTKLLASISTEDNETIHEILANANETLKGFRTVGGDITKTTEKFNKTADEFTLVAKNFNKDLPAIMAKIDSITTYLNSIGATVDKKLPPAMDKFIKLEDNLNNTIEKKDSSLNKALTSVDGFFTEGTETMEKIDKYLDSMVKSELHVELRADEVYDDGGYSKTQFNLALKPDATRHYMIGLTSAPSFKKDEEFSRGFAGNKKHEGGEYLFSAQYGKRFDDLLFRIGMIDGTGGFGIDYFGWNDTLKVSANLYDFNAVNDIRGTNPNFSATVRYQFFRHINAYLSGNNLLNSRANSISAGLGVSFVDNDLKNLLGSAASAAQ
jgi:phospholipid/cholesterol/gamma-HCH transport system substrate-binding protein